MISLRERAKIRCSAYAALGILLLFATWLAGTWRAECLIALGALAFWWGQLDPVGPDGLRHEPRVMLARWRRAIVARLHRLLPVG